jgi:phage gp36-like protein
MATTIRIDSFNELNIVERSELGADYVAASTVLKLKSTQGIVNGQVIYVGQLSREGVEKAVVNTVGDETTINLTQALKLPHTRHEPVTAVLGDSIHIYRAPNVDGTVPADGLFTVLTTRTIDPDQLSTYYKDSTGSSAFWYRYTYFNPLSLDETPLDAFDAFRGDDFNHYASLAEIRKEAGFEKAYNLADSDVELQRTIAEAEINSSLSGAYTVPFTPVPAIIRSLTIQLAAALLLVNAYGETAGNRQKLKDARAAIDRFKNRESVLTDEAGTALGNSDTVTAWPDEGSPRSFYIGQQF